MIVIENTVCDNVVCKFIILWNYDSSFLFFLNYNKNICKVLTIWIYANVRTPLLKGIQKQHRPSNGQSQYIFTLFNIQLKHQTNYKRTLFKIEISDIKVYVTCMDCGQCNTGGFNYWREHLSNEQLDCMYCVSITDWGSLERGMACSNW